MTIVHKPNIAHENDIEGITRDLYMAMPGVTKPVPLYDWQEVQATKHWVFCNMIARLIAGAAPSYDQAPTDPAHGGKIWNATP